MGRDIEAKLSEIIKNAQRTTKMEQGYFAFLRNLMYQIKEESLLLRVLEDMRDNDFIGRLSALTRYGEITNEPENVCRSLLSKKEEKEAFLRGRILGCNPCEDKSISEVSVDLSECLPLFHLLASLDDRFAEALICDRITKDPHSIVPALQLSALLQRKLFSEEDIQKIIDNREPGGILLRPAIDYAGEMGFADLLKSNRHLAGHEDCSVVYSYLDALAYSGELDSSILADTGVSLAPAMESFTETMISAHDSFLTGFSDHGTEKIILAQTVFHGDPSQAGKGSAGGVGTLLAALAEELPSANSIYGVCTITAVPTRYWGIGMKTVERLSTDHTVLRIPVCSGQGDKESSFRKLYPEILLRLRHSMKLLKIRPDILHLRYADFATLAASRLADEIGSKIVFTVTPDPHRSLSSGNSAHSALSVESVSEKLTKVFISDWLIRFSDGLIGIGGEHSKIELKRFFPELKDPVSSTGAKLVMLPEGVIPGEFCPLVNRSKAVEDLVFDPAKRYRLSTDRRNRQALLTVGRLSTLKGQHRLVKAWADSELPLIFNLILIGGDLESPSDEEREVLDEIDAVLLNRRDLEGAFCHLGALDNRTVRCLQNTLAGKLSPGGFNVYVAPSLKEEFGLAILEAMSAGFLAIAPIMGGVSTYIEDGMNGFLIDTTSSETIRKALEHILLERAYSTDDLRRIAAKGMETVLKQYNLKKIAKRYAEYYAELTARSRQENP